MKLNLKISKLQMMEVTLLLFQNLFKVISKKVSRSGYPVVRFIWLKFFQIFFSVIHAAEVDSKF